MSSTLNILEYLYLHYSQELVNILWTKQLDPHHNKLELRDDLSYWLIQFVYPRLTPATTGSPSTKATTTRSTKLLLLSALRTFFSATA
jgi:hypothetical protein